MLGLLSLILGSPQPQPFVPVRASVQLLPQWDLLAALNAPDPVAEVIVQAYVQGLAAAGFPASEQGVWIQTGTEGVATHQGAIAFPAASLTKVATTLAALDRWGAEHQFETRVGLRGSLGEDGVLSGDLVVQGGGDPLFVWEEAIALGNALEALGVRQVTGNLIVAGNFAMNFQTVPTVAGTLLRQGIDGQRWSSEVTAQHREMPPDTPIPQVAIAGTIIAEADAEPAVDRWLVNRRSLPLAAILKAMNIYSNNVMSDLVADSVGGTAEMVAIAQQAANLEPGELRLINGSGLGEANQISAQSVVAMLTATQRALQSSPYNLADLYPIAGEDQGTLAFRNLPDQAALKTGTLATVSTLAGVFPSRDRGPVWFAILNRGGNLDSLRQRQDQLLQQLQMHWGVAEASPMLRSQLRFNQGAYRLGDPERSETL